MKTQTLKIALLIFVFSLMLFKTSQAANIELNLTHIRACAGLTEVLDLPIASEFDEPKLQVSDEENTQSIKVNGEKKNQESKDSKGIELENWMTDYRFFTIDDKKQKDSEEMLEIENWMTNQELWKF